MKINNFPTSEQILDKYPQIKKIGKIDTAFALSSKGMPFPAITLTHAGIKGRGALCDFYVSSEYAWDLYIAEFFKFLDENVKNECELIWRTEPELVRAHFHSFIEIDHKIYPKKEIYPFYVFSRLLILPISEVEDDK